MALGSRSEVYCLVADEGSSHHVPVSVQPVGHSHTCRLSKLIIELASKLEIWEGSVLGNPKLLTNKTVAKTA